eukprot:gene654-3962_t
MVPPAEITPKVDNVGEIFTFNPKHRFSTKNNFMTGITLGPWITVLWKYGGDIEWKTYWFRALFLSIMACINSMLALLERVIFGRHIRDATVNQRPVFILGHPRTGTTHLHNLIALDSDIFFCPTTLSAGFSAAYLLLHPVRSLLSGLLSKTRPMDNMPLSFDVPQEDELSHTEKEFRKYFRMQDVPPDEKRRYTDVFLAFLQKIAVHAEGRRIVLKSPTHTAKIKFFLDLFPNAQFIYIHRNPYDVFKSAMNMADKTYWYSYLATPSPSQIVEFVMNQYEELHNAYVSDRECIPEGNIVEVSFADLEANPLSTLRSIYTKLGWSEFDTRMKPKLNSYLANINGFQKNRLQPLSNLQRKAINDRWSAAFKDFRYSVDLGES